MGNLSEGLNYMNKMVKEKGLQYHLNQTRNECHIHSREELTDEEKAKVYTYMTVFTSGMRIVFAKKL